MSMTRKHYVVIADAIKIHTPHPDNGYSTAELEMLVCKGIAEQIAFAMQRDNPAFDKARFLEACGVTDRFLKAVTQ